MYNHSNDNSTSNSAVVQNKQRGRRKKIRTEPVRPICPQCNKQFSNQSALTKHKLTHSDERRFVCKQCSKAFKRHDHLTGHMLTHSNRKPFECNVQGCDKTYCDARSLRRHKEHHHNILTIRGPIQIQHQSLIDLVNAPEDAISLNQSAPLISNGSLEESISQKPVNHTSTDQNSVISTNLNENDKIHHQKLTLSTDVNTNNPTVQHLSESDVNTNIESNIGIQFQQEPTLSNENLDNVFLSRTEHVQSRSNLTDNFSTDTQPGTSVQESNFYQKLPHQRSDLLQRRSRIQRTWSDPGTCIEESSNAHGIVHSNHIQHSYSRLQCISTSSYDHYEPVEALADVINERGSNRRLQDDTNFGDCHSYYEDNLEGPCLNEGVIPINNDQIEHVIQEENQLNQVSCATFRPTVARDTASNMNCYNQAVTYQSYHESLPNTPILHTNATPYSNFFQSTDCISTTNQHQVPVQQYDCGQDQQTDDNNLLVADNPYISDHDLNSSLHNAINHQFQMHHISSNSIRQPSISLPATPTDQNQHFTFPTGLHTRPMFGAYNNSNYHHRISNNVNQGHNHGFAYHHRHSEEVYASQVSLDDYSSSTTTSNLHYSTSSRLEDDYNPNDDLLNHKYSLPSDSSNPPIIRLANPNNHVNPNRFKNFTSMNSPSCNSFNQNPESIRPKYSGMKQMPISHLGFDLGDELDDDVFSESDNQIMNVNNHTVYCDMNNNNETGGKICKYEEVDRRHDVEYDTHSSISLNTSNPNQSRVSSN